MMMDSVKFEEKYAMPEGNYVVVTWDMLTTGLSLHDDICQIVAYAPGFEVFSQHVMPYHNMSVGSRRRYNLNVISSGHHRMLKDMRQNKVLETKPDFMALFDFMDWLNDVKGTSDGVILVAHDPRKLLSSVLMEVVSTYKMKEQFCSIVKGFANCYIIAESKCSKTVRTNSIRSLSQVLLNNEEELNEATERAQATYKILEHIFEPAAGDAAEGDESKKVPRELFEDVRDFCCTMDGVNKITADLKALQEREESLQPLFGSMRNNRADRQRSFNLQRLLARSNIDYEILTDIYKKGGLDAINEVLKCTMAQEHARELEELKHVFAMHFDPEYKGEWKPERPAGAAGDRPPRTSFRRNSRAKKQRNGGNRKNPSSPDSEPKGVDGKPPSDSPTECHTPSGDAVAVPALTITNDKNQTQTVVAAI